MIVIIIITVIGTVIKATATFLLLTITNIINIVCNSITIIVLV